MTHVWIFSDVLAGNGIYIRRLRVEIEKTIPDGFLKSYISYASTLTDAPVEFHLMTGLSLLSVAAGSSVTYRGFGGDEHWCNLYTLIIAPTGFFRKSTALAIGRRILTKANKELILPNEQTRERFLSELQEKPTSILFVPEFAAQLSLWGREYMGGMKEIITELYDPASSYVRQTMKAQKVIIIRPSLTILAATTSEWLIERLTVGDMRGGLMGRFLICPSGQKTRWQGLPEPSDPIIEDELADYLQALNYIERATVNLKAIKEPLNTWLQSMENKDWGSDMAGFISRLGNHTIKLTILYHLSFAGVQNEYEIDTDSLNKAMMLTSYLMEKLKELSQTTLTVSKVEQGMQRLLQRISKNTGECRANLLRFSHLKEKDFDALINTLVSRNEITITSEKTSGRPRIVYHLRSEESEVR